MLTTIKDLNLSEEKIQEIAKTLGWSIQDVLECDDFHTTNSALSMMKWMYDEASGCDILDRLDSLNVMNPQLSLFENFFLHHEHIFFISDDCYLFFYI